MNNIITELVAEESIFKSNNPIKRYYEEEKSLEKCLRQSGYLCLYNAGIRYCFLLLLKNGFDIKGKNVHFVFKYFMKYYLKKEEKMTTNIISARHLLKYNLTQPRQEIIQQMDDIINELKYLLDHKN